MGPGRWGVDGPKTEPGRAGNRHGPKEVGRDIWFGSGSGPRLPPRDWPGVFPIGVQNMYRFPRASLPLAVA